MRIALTALLAAAALAACSQPQTAQPVATAVSTYDPATLPNGDMGASIRYGHDIMVDTPRIMKNNVVSDMSCSACHVQAGLKPKGGSLVGVYAQFPQWNKRAHRIITLQDRLAECFLYSMNGKPPAYQSREMVALVAYIAYLSKGVKVGATPEPAVRLAHFEPPQKPDPKRGEALYKQQCLSCHGANGAGVSGEFPPLWGPTSFNGGAGMHRLWTMAGFVRYNMPANAPGSMTDQQAYDVSAYVLSHARPAFQGKQQIDFQANEASYF